MRHHFSHRYHPYESQGEIKARLHGTQTTVKRKTESCALQGSPQASGSTSHKCGSQPPQVSKIGKYLILERITGTLFHKAVDTQTRLEYSCRIVEIKKYRDYISPYFMLDHHKNVNKVVEVLVGESYAYIIFEPSYGDLHSYVRSRRRLKEDEAGVLFKEIVSAVSHCHSAGLVLRDLKLRKFVFQDKNRTTLKLESLDDAVLVADKEDLLTDKHGCPAYVSPEILESTNGYSGRAADIWSLGVMFYTMLLGRYPFHDNEPSVLFSKIRIGQFVIPDCISSRARCLLRSILRREPNERLTASEVLEHPWFCSNTRGQISSRTERKVSDQTVPDFVFDDASGIL